MLSSFIDSSVDNVPLQSLLEFIDIPKQRPIDSLLYDTANGLRSGLLEATDPQRRFIDFFVHFNAYIACSDFCR